VDENDQEVAHFRIAAHAPAAHHRG
jgi:hypothetical protein